MGDPRRSTMFPIALIVVGAVALLDTLGLVSFRDVRHLLAAWWPLIPIGIGVFLLLERRR